ncbi:MAG: HAD family hydrolase [archaeon]
MNKAIFLDRDGVINKIRYHHEIGIYSAKNLEEFVVLPKVKEAIAILKSLGYKIIVITNQPGIAFGYIKKEDMEEINTYMKEELGVDAVYVCPHHPDHSGECECRKPKLGLFKKAAEENDIDFSESINIGDNVTDMLAGKRCKNNYLIGPKRLDIETIFEEYNIMPDKIFKSLYDAAKYIELNS